MPPVTRYLRVEAYYQYAARLAGATVQESLDATLRNSTVCTAIAKNSTAYGAMKTNYSSTMVSYVDNASYWNTGLNYLNFVCKIKSYLFHGGNACTDITGGWSGSWTNNLSGSTKGVSNTGSAYYAYFIRDNDAGNYTDTCTIKTANSINLSGYSKVYWNLYQTYKTYSSKYIYSNTNTVDISSNNGTFTSSVTAATGIQKYEWAQSHANVGTKETYIYNVYVA